MLVIFITGVAKAIVWLVVGLVAATVLGVIVWGLKEMTLRINEPGVPSQDPHIPQNVLRVYMEDIQTGLYDFWIYDSLALAAGGIGGAMVETPIESQQSSPSIQNQLLQTGGFSVTYGFETNLYMAVGTNTGNYYGGRVEQSTNGLILYSAGMVVQFWFDPAATNTFGMASRTLDNDPTNYPVEILRSTNLVDWDSVYTDFYFMRHALKTWTDNNPPGAPCFYRGHLLEVAPQ